MKSVLALRHVHFEDLGTLEPLFRERGYDVRYVDPTLGGLAELDPQAPDLIVALGGPIGAHDESRYAFLAGELQFLTQRLESGRPLLGICLGAQLMARALGAPVAAMGHKEIGFGALTLTDAGNESALASLAGVPVMHWHGDRFGLPEGSTRLAHTELCDQQAFARGNTVLGLQFHLEADAERIESWLVGHAGELDANGIDPRTLRHAAAKHGKVLRMAAQKTVGRWLDGL